MARNEAVAFSPDGVLLARYAKIHPFTLGGESIHHERGTNIVTFECGGFIVAPFVCYDLRFPEIFRAAALLHDIARHDEDAAEKSETPNVAPPLDHAEVSAAPVWVLRAAWPLVQETAQVALSA